MEINDIKKLSPKERIEKLRELEKKRKEEKEREIMENTHF